MKCGGADFSLAARAHIEREQSPWERLRASFVGLAFCG
jgi:hypothetical protein